MALRKTSLAIASAAALAAPAAANDDPVSTSVAAGYKAAFTCSGVFNAGRSVDDIAGDELNRVYKDYREPLAALPPATIDRKAKTVSVTYADDMPPRVAVWRPHLGCVQLPTGADPANPPTLPRIDDLERSEKAPLPVDLSDSIRLIATIDAAFDRATYGEGTETSAVLVVKDGTIIAEKYRGGFGPETPQRTWSVAKSIAASVIGAAVYQGILSTDEPAGPVAWSSPGDPRGAITFDNLLRMSSGLTSPTAGNRTDDVYLGGGRVVDHAITNRLVAEPGTRFRYANNDTMAAIRALRERMNDD